MQLQNVIPIPDKIFDANLIEEMNEDDEEND
jgi:hypothetical protein